MEFVTEPPKSFALGGARLGTWSLNTVSLSSAPAGPNVHLD